MKTQKIVFKQTPVYLNNWKSKADLIADFEDIHITEAEYMAKETPHSNKEMWEEDKAKLTKAIIKYKNIHILFASYGYEDYSGSAFVLYKYKNKLYEVNGGHCSCYGLEGQWEPEKTSLKALKYRILEGTLGGDGYCENTFKTELLEFLGIK